MLKAIIFDIKRFSIYDGPGIRTTIFFKGCYLDCPWCQNPEGKAFIPSLYYEQKKCINCKNCLKVCPIVKINDSKENRFSNKLDCLPECEKCYILCPSKAIYKVGKEYTIDELVQVALKDHEFFQLSGGGVTLTGGEPLININFINSFIKKLKKYNINIAVETSGFIKWNDFYRIIKCVDKFYYDLKIIDDELHIQYIGHPKKKIMDNLIKLSKLHKDITIRIPLIPKITDTENNLQEIIKFLKDKDLHGLPVELLSYNHLAEVKYNKQGINCDSINPYFKSGIKTQSIDSLKKMQKKILDNKINARILSID